MISRLSGFLSHMGKDLYFMKYLHITLFVFAVLMASGHAWADIGPKPTILITLPANLSDRVKSGTLILCQRSDCQDGQSLQDIGPQGFYCMEKECSGLAYGFAPYLQLKIILKDKSSISSNVFTKKDFDAHFISVFSEGKLQVSEK